MMDSYSPHSNSVPDSTAVITSEIIITKSTPSFDFDTADERFRYFLTCPKKTIQVRE